VEQIAFEGKQLDDVIRGLGGNGAQASAEIVILAPEIAENGAVVPMQIISKLDKTENIAIVVEKNPNPLAANFTIPDGTLPDIQTRVKMAQTCSVYALVRAAANSSTAPRKSRSRKAGAGARFRLACIDARQTSQFCALVLPHRIERPMTNPMKIRAKADGAVVEVKI
jgi:sulfur-oxidizing protein SoxY